MSCDKIGYNVESLHKDKIENLEKELESQTKLITIKPSDMQQSWLEEKIEIIKEINFDDGETKVVVNAKLFLGMKKDISKLVSQIEDIKLNLNYLE